MEVSNVTDPRLALVAFGIAVAVMLAVFWPGSGILYRLRRRASRTDRSRLEDALKQLYHATTEGDAPSVDRLAGSLEVNRDRAMDLVTRLQARGLARPEGPGVGLTDEGRAYALRVIRSHRLWERYLADRTGVRPEDWHDVAEEREHDLDDDQVERLAARMGQPRFDPHGDPIPTATGELPPPLGVPLSTLQPGDAGTVVHLEDEPREAFERLRGAGFALGRPIVVRGAAPASLEVEVDGAIVSIPRVMTPAVTVSRHPARATAPPRSLADLTPGQAAKVLALSPSCRGAQRRRLLDLGIVPGTEIRAELVSVGGDPIAYRVRGALVALRRNQAALIAVEPEANRTGESP